MWGAILPLLLLLNWIKLLFYVFFLRGGSYVGLLREKGCGCRCDRVRGWFKTFTRVIKESTAWVVELWHVLLSCCHVCLVRQICIYKAATKRSPHLDQFSWYLVPQLLSWRLRWSLSPTSNGRRSRSGVFFGSLSAVIVIRELFFQDDPSTFK